MKKIYYHHEYKPGYVYEFHSLNHHYIAYIECLDIDVKNNTSDGLIVYYVFNELTRKGDKNIVTQRHDQKNIVNYLDWPFDGSAYYNDYNVYEYGHKDDLPEMYI